MHLQSLFHLRPCVTGWPRAREITDDLTFYDRREKNPKDRAHAEGTVPRIGATLALKTRHSAVVNTDTFLSLDAAIFRFHLRSHEKNN